MIAGQIRRSFRYKNWQLSSLFDSSVIADNLHYLQYRDRLTP